MRGGGRRCKIHQVRLPPELENSDSHLNLAPTAWLRKANSFQVWRHRYILCKTLTGILLSLSSPQINLAWHILGCSLETQAVFKELLHSRNEENRTCYSATCHRMPGMVCGQHPRVVPQVFMLGQHGPSPFLDGRKGKIIVCCRANTLQRSLQDPYSKTYCEKYMTM